MIIVGENETVESYIRRFKKYQEREEILKDWREHEFFTKKSLKRHTAARKPKRKIESNESDRESKMR